MTPQPAITSPDLLAAAPGTPPDLARRGPLAAAPGTAFRATDRQAASTASAPSKTRRPT
ncbi:hypothetical protein ACWCRD_37920 [Streptomyces sp. NPDC002092]